MPLDTKDRDVLARKVAVSGRDGMTSYYLYSFYDRGRAAKEEADWFRHNKGKAFSRQEPEEKQAEFGTIAFESDVDREPGEIYKLSDERWLVKEFFRYYKDEDGFDDTKVQYDTSVIGSEFINFIASLMTARLVNRFDSLGLFRDNSYRDLMSDLAQAEKTRTGKDSQWLYVQLPLEIQEKSEDRRRRKPGKPRKDPVQTGPKRKRGRPLGSKNKPKKAIED